MSNIPATYTSDRQIVREFTKDGQVVARNRDRFLVERQDDGWKMVEPTDRFVSTEELGKNFGLWKDEEKTTGMLWWKKTERPFNGQIEGDEVIPMGDVLKTQHDSIVSYYPNTSYHRSDRLMALSSELTLTKDGGNLHTNWQNLYRHDTSDFGLARNSYLV